MCHPLYQSWAWPSRPAACSVSWRCGRPHPCVCVCVCVHACVRVCQPGRASSGRAGQGHPTLSPSRPGLTTRSLLGFPRHAPRSVGSLFVLDRGTNGGRFTQAGLMKALETSTGVAAAAWAPSLGASASPGAAARAPRPVKPSFLLVPSVAFWVSTLAE